MIDFISRYFSNLKFCIWHRWNNYGYNVSYRLINPIAYYKHYRERTIFIKAAKELRASKHNPHGYSLSPICSAIDIYSQAIVNTDEYQLALKNNTPYVVVPVKNRFD